MESDLGADGPAARARPSALCDLGAKYRGSVARGELILARRYADVTLHDALYGRGDIDDRQYAAADKLFALWVYAGFAPRCCGRYGRPRGPLACDDPSEEGSDPTAQYRAAMRSLAPPLACAVEAMLHGQAARRDRLRAGLDLLARWFGLDSA